MMRGELSHLMFVQLGRRRIPQFAPCVQEGVPLPRHLSAVHLDPKGPASYQIGLLGMNPRPFFPSRLIKQTDMISQNALQARDTRLVDVAADILSQHLQAE